MMFRSPMAVLNLRGFFDYLTHEFIKVLLTVFLNIDVPSAVFLGCL
jgi:hypothetical protein